MARFNPDSIAKHWPFNRFFAVVTGGFELPKKGYARIELRLQVSFFPNASRRVLVLLWPGLRRVRSTLLLCSQTVATVCNPLQRFATVCNRPQPFVSDRRGGNMAVPMAISAKVSLLEVLIVVQARFAWQAWHFVTFQHVSLCMFDRGGSAWMWWCECSPAALCLKLANFHC